MVVPVLAARSHALRLRSGQPEIALNKPHTDLTHMSRTTVVIATVKTVIVIVIATTLIIATVIVSLVSLFLLFFTEYLNSDALA